jgi:hypothetical protein
MEPAREEMFTMRGPYGDVEVASKGAKASATRMGPTTLVSKLACMLSRLRGPV